MADSKAAPAAGKKLADAAKSSARPVLSIASGKGAISAASAPLELPSLPKVAQPAAPVTWSEEDEKTLKALTARRKAAGYVLRGRDVGSQQLRAGEIAPNPGTVASTIVGLFGSGSVMARSELLGAMASTDFSHPKAQPKDKGWCQGYVAGLIRNGFLVVADDTPARIKS